MMARMMLLSQFLRMKPDLLIRSTSVSRCLRDGSSSQCFLAFRRSFGTLNAAKAIPNAGERKPMLPERVLVFHAGTGRSVFLGCLKVTTIFIFSFFCLVVAPAHFKSEEQPKWVAAGVLLSGVVPVVCVAYITSPFVAHIHLRVPTFARYSREMVVRYSQSIPKDAKLEITTVNFVGMPRVTRLSIADLRPAKGRLGMVNYVRDTRGIDSKRPWWMGRSVRQFGVHGGTRIAQGNGVWENIARTIERRSL